MDQNIKLEIWRIASAYIFVVILLFIVRARGISREKDILISTFRMTIQLVLVGYLLIYLFENIRPINTIIIIVVMEVFSIHNIFKRSKRQLSKKTKKVIAFSMILGTLTSLSYFILVVINAKPWYDPKSFIPLAGMFIGNSMTGISLGINKLVEGMYTNKNLVESSLMLGASPKVAAKPIVDDAFDSAILPTLNSMLGMGIVFLPGMMTGQILAGLSPLTAIQYQTVIMLGILGAVSLTVILFLELGYKSFFNKEEQLVLGEQTV